MRVYEILMRLQQELPEANYRDFLKVVHGVVLDLCGKCNWNHLRAQTTYTVTQSIDPLGVTSADATITAPADTFHADHVGETITITSGGDDYEVEIASVTSDTSAELTAVWAEATDAAATATVRRIYFPMPANLASVVSLAYEDSAETLKDPRDYELGNRVDGVRPIVFVSDPELDTNIILEYWRRPTEATAMQTEIDLGSELDEAVYLGVLERLLARMVPPDNYMIRARDAKMRYVSEWRRAKTQNNTERHQQARNSRVLFRIGK